MINIVNDSVELLFDEIYGFESNMKSVLNGAEMSFMKPVKTEPKKFLRKLLELKHYACLEHTDFLIKIKSPNDINDGYHFFYLRNKFKDIENYLYRYHIIPQKGIMLAGSYRDFLELNNFLNDFIISDFLKDYRLFKDSIEEFLKDFLNIEKRKNAKYDILSWNDKNTARQLFGINKSKQRIQFRIKTNRYTTDQIRTHRNLSVLMESQRRVDYSKGFDIVLPKNILEEQKQMCIDFSEISYNMYKDLLKNKVKREDARGILPIWISSTITVTASLENWAEFCNKRMVPESQSNIRYIAENIYQILLNFWKYDLRLE